MDSPTSLTERLRSYATGDRNSANVLILEIFPRLRRIAAAKLKSEQAGTQVTPTDLVGEVWATSLHRGYGQVENREHFFSIVGKAMQNVLTDMARKRLAARRGKGASHVSLESVSEIEEPMAVSAEQIVILGQLLDQLAKKDAQVALIVQLHYLAGFSLEEIVAETGLTLRQVRHRWQKGKEWLAIRLASGPSQFRPKPQDPE